MSIFIHDIDGLMQTSEDPDQIASMEQSHLSLHCLQKRKTLRLLAG